MKKWGSMVGSVLLAIAVLSGCSVANKSESALMMQDKASMDMEKSEAGGSAASAASDKELKATATNSTATAAGSGGVLSVNQSAAAEAGLNRKIMYKANLTMQVEDYGASQSQIRDMAALSGGYILQFTENAATFERGGTFVLKVPANGFSSFLKDLETIKHKSLQRNVQGQDVSEEYVDMEARLKAKQVVEARLLAFMEKATKTEELVSFSNELGKVQEEIERVKGRMRFIDQNVSFSTVEIRVYQRLDGKIQGEEEAAPPVWQRAEKALKGSLGFVKSFFEWIIVLVAAILPIAVIASIVGIPLWYILRAKQRKGKDIAERQRSLQQKKEQNQTVEPPHRD